MVQEIIVLGSYWILWVWTMVSNLLTSEQRIIPSLYTLLCEFTP